MRTIVILLSTLFVAVPCALLAGQASGADADASSVPRSLDAFYPPLAKQPVYLLGMLDLESYFSGIAADVMEGDLGGARDNFEEFRKKYVSAREMVPEWAPYYPQRPIEELAAAFDGSDRTLIMQAFGEVGKTCHQCHLSKMVPVQQRFRWGDFSSVAVKDPLTGEVLPFPQFKKLLATSLTGIGVNLRQGQTDKALRQFEGFRARFQGLRQSCRSCHDRDSRHYVDEEAQVRIEALGRALGDRDATPGKLSSLLQEIGRESCSKCHLVHVPAAFAKAEGR
jgi:hypothetical protein